MNPIQTDFVQLLKRRIASPQRLMLKHEKAPMADAILRQLQSSEAPGGHSAVRASSLGKCSRALAYSIAGTPENGRGMDWRSRITFALGDMTEIFITTALEEALIGSDWMLLGSRADGQFSGSLDLEVNGKTIEIPCHTDGFLVNSRTKEPVLLEVKSTSSYGFKRLESKIRAGEAPWDPSESYWWQIQTYMHATTFNCGVFIGPEHLSSAYVIVLCKDSGALLGFYIDKDPGFLEMATAHLERSTVETPTDAPRMLPGGSQLGPRVDLHKRTGKPNRKHGTLAWQCCYCSWYRDCWGPMGLIETVEGRAKTLRITEEL